MMRERNALLAKMAGNELEQMHFASDKIAELAEWPEQLSKNGVAEYCCYREFCFAFWTGVS